MCHLKSDRLRVRTLYREITSGKCNYESERANEKTRSGGRADQNEREKDCVCVCMRVSECLLIYVCVFVSGFGRKKNSR